jgi:hypothetical protein
MAAGDTNADDVSESGYVDASMAKRNLLASVHLRRYQAVEPCNCSVIMW